MLDPVRLALGLTQAQGYRTRHPFPHAVLRDCFDPDLLKLVASQFPGLDSPAWDGFKDGRVESKKHASNKLGLFQAELATVLIELNTAYFLDWLERLTGIQGLIPDPYFLGGGIHATERGGHLGIHTDFNRHWKLGLDRRLNVLIYLNEDWHSSWGGELALYERQVATPGSNHPWTPSERPVVWVPPVLGTMVVFDTSPWSFHGHSEPLACPDGVLRKSLALYYYTAGRPVAETLPSHDTVFFVKES